MVVVEPPGWFISVRFHGKHPSLISVVTITTDGCMPPRHGQSRVRFWCTPSILHLKASRELHGGPVAVGPEPGPYFHASPCSGHNRAATMAERPSIVDGRHPKHAPQSEQQMRAARVLLEAPSPALAAAWTLYAAA